MVSAAKVLRKEVFLRNNNWYKQLLNFTTFLLISYTAWKGFLKSGRGAVVCNINNAVELSGITFTTVTGKKISPDETFNLHFVTKARLTGYLTEWILYPKEITQILAAVDTYNPQKDIILFIKFNSDFEVNILENLVISPPECYQYVCRRWEEFLPYLL
ncbi:MAG: hypothetical protein HXY43_15440 [Fischerella sp.]|jgi:hypothetical protein|uniref:hypothetical protein n=1 Tax=Fischerella sp. TaxID=1191 RepID=UPI0017AE29D4|nr:hypothetical protein [Fischerella sp.]NWF60607.1 hypothetical protein [Fischerella sp.]